jgi:protein SCO1/2
LATIADLVPVDLPGLVIVAEPVERATPVRRLLLIALMCLVLGALGGVLAAIGQDRPQPVAARFLPPPEQAFDFSLRDEHGRRTSLADARGKVIAMTFVYSSCRDLCPAEGNDIAAAMRLAGERGLIAYMISVDPVGDTPQRIESWLNWRGLYGAAGHYLIGTRAELQPVWRHYGIAPLNATRAEAEAAAIAADQFRASVGDKPPKGFKYQRPPQPASPPPRAGDAYPDTGDLAYRGHARHIAGWDYEHSAYVLLIDKRGVQRVGIPFEQLTPESLARDMRVLLAER